MKHLLQILLFCITMLIGLKTHAVSYYQDVESLWEAKDLFVAKVKFSGPVDGDAIKVKFIKQTIQLDIPGAIIKSDSESHKVEKNNVKMVYTYQMPNEIIRTRIIYEKPVKAKDYKSSIRYSVAGDQLVIKVKNPGVTWASLDQDNIHDIKPVDLEEELKKVMEAKKVNRDQESQLGVALKEADSEKKATQQGVSKKEVVKEKQNKKDKAVAASTAKKEVPESQIPVFSQSKKHHVEKSGSISRMMISLLVIVVLAIGSVMLSKWWSKNHKVNVDTNKIKVLTQHHLGPKKSLAIIRVAGESILIGVTDSNISMIKTLSLIDDEIPINVPTNFSKTLEKHERENVEVAHLDDEILPAESEIENFSYGNIKNSITSKLKSMRQI